MPTRAPISFRASIGSCAIGSALTSLMILSMASAISKPSIQFPGILLEVTMELSYSGIPSGSSWKESFFITFSFMDGVQTMIHGLPRTPTEHVR